MAERSKLPNTKLTKTNFLLAFPDLKRHIPKTALESKENVQRFLNTFNTVFLKPNGGQCGHGVIRVKITKEGFYTYQINEKIYNFSTFDELYQSLSPYFQSRKYLIQKGIPLLKFRNRPFDVRVMVQKNPKRKWEVTGLITRLAQKKKIVTNYHQGGTLIPLEKAIQPHLNEKETEKLIAKISRLSLRIAEELGKGYPLFSAFGVDLGLDTDVKPWIIEVNTRPDPYIFKKLDDKSIFQKIMLYKRANRKAQKNREMIN